MRDIFHNFSDNSVKLIRKVYQKIPPPFNYGYHFLQYSNWLKKTQWLPEEDIKIIQEKLFLKLIRHAYSQVPYYKTLFQKNGISLSEIKSLDDIHKIPIMTKEDIRNNFPQLIAYNYKTYSPSLHHTSGSTGEPVHYYIDKKLSALISSIVWRHWNWCGIKYNDKIAVFRGTLINEFGKKAPCYYRIDNNGKQLHFSTFHMNDSVMDKYINKLNSYKPDLIRGYPASLEILSNFIVNNNKSIIKPKAIHTSSEMLLPSQRKIIEQAFGAPVFDWYSHGESTVAAGECEQHSGLHLNSEFGYTEFIPENSIDSTNKVYKIISTSLWNYSMPIIRYDTEDLVELNGKKCNCGRGLPLINKVIGRRADILIGSNNIKISPSSMVHFWKYRIAGQLQDIIFSQIIQYSEKRITILLVGPKNTYNEKMIESEMKKLLGDMDISFEYLDRIPSGEKWRFTISKIKE